MDPLLFRATITVEVLAVTRREAERRFLQVARAIDATAHETNVTTAFPLPEAHAVPTQAH